MMMHLRFDLMIISRKVPPFFMEIGIFERSPPDCPNQTLKRFYQWVTSASSSHKVRYESGRHHIKIRSGGQSELAAYMRVRADSHGSHENTMFAGRWPGYLSVTIIIFFDNIRQGKLQHLVAAQNVFIRHWQEPRPRESQKRKKFVPRIRKSG